MVSMLLPYDHDQEEKDEIKFGGSVTKECGDGGVLGFISQRKKKKRNLGFVLKGVAVTELGLETWR